MKIKCPICTGTGKIPCTEDVDWLDKNGNANCPICFSEDIEVYDFESFAYWFKLLIIRIKHELGTRLE
jgi:hypothetical protein